MKHTPRSTARQELLGEAQRERLLAAAQPQSTRLERLLARTGRLLIQIGTQLETRYASPSLSADFAD